MLILELPVPYIAGVLQPPTNQSATPLPDTPTSPHATLVVKTPQPPPTYVHST